MTKPPPEKHALRWVAFLRAINVGGHNVKMAQLKRLFQDLGLASVETFIASGNVLFQAPQCERRELARQIEEQLLAALGYPVATFIRSTAEVAAIAARQPFGERQMTTAGALSVGFLDAPLSGASKRLLSGLQTEIDRFEAHGREVYWWCARKQSESTFSNAMLEKTLGKRSTFRSLNTVSRLAAKYCLQ